MIRNPDATPARLTDEAPGDMLIGDNVRSDIRLDKTSIASIRERGVLEPVVAYEDDDGSR